MSELMLDVIQEVKVEKCPCSTGSGYGPHSGVASGVYFRILNYFEPCTAHVKAYIKSFGSQYEKYIKEITKLDESSGTIKIVKTTAFRVKWLLPPGDNDELV